MISGTQDDEDTQSDEAEAEAEAEEEQFEEAKVAADPEDQPAASRHRRKKKRQKKKHRKGSCREQLRQYFLRRKNTSQKAKKLAQQYDYTGAISVLKNNWKFATSDKMQEAAAAYMKKEMPVWNIHLRISPMYFFIP